MSSMKSALAGILAAMMSLGAAASLTATVSAAEDTDPYIVYPGILGPVKVGMTVDEATKALGAGWTYRGMVEDNDMTCGHISRDGLWPDTSPFFMAQAGIVTNITFTSGSIYTEKGIHVGSTEAEVMTAYGKEVRSEPHQYQAPPAKYLTVWFENAPKGDNFAEDPKARGIKFETNEQKVVTGIYSGDTSIMYVEGCA